MASRRRSDFLNRNCKQAAIAQSFALRVLATLQSEDSNDWQSYFRPGSMDRLRDNLVRSARNCGPVRWKVEHARGDYQRTLRKYPHRRRYQPRPNFFDWRILRCLPYSVGRERFRFGSDSHDRSGWPAYCPWDRAVHPHSGSGDVVRHWAFGRLLGRLDRRSLLIQPFRPQAGSSIPLVKLILRSPHPSVPLWESFYFP
jgi:hypothetical protein